MVDDKLRKYKKKRDFSVTPEPYTSGKTSSKPRFVVQKHKARSLHYDFRLEVEGVLKSWAIPKGPSIDYTQKRLAVPTEDHPIDYIDFEGTIPQGNYGAGTVMVWDTGTYRNLKKEDDQEIPMEETIEEGHVEFYLEGEKLKGTYALIQTGKEGKKFWLFFKMKDLERNKTDILIERPESVLSGLTMEELEERNKNTSLDEYI